MHKAEASVFEYESKLCVAGSPLRADGERGASTGGRGFQGRADAGIGGNNLDPLPAFKVREKWDSEYEQKIAAAKSIFKTLPVQHARTVDHLLNRLSLGSDQHLIERLAFFGEHRALNIRRG